MACCRCRAKTRNIVLFSIGSLLIALGTALTISWSVIFKSILSSQLSLTKDSKSYDMWKETPIPMFLDVYLFNLTNPDEVAKSNWKVRPNFSELGPYVFKEKHTRVDVVWNDNSTVTFKQIRNWEFVPQSSKGSLKDTVTNLNVIAAVVAKMVKKQNIIIQKAVDIFMREEKETLFVTHTVDELLFTGYDDNLLRIMKNITIPGLNFPFTKFGWFVDREGNPDYDGLFTMYTGVDDFNNLGMMTRWNGKDHNGFYDGACGTITGTTGEIWPPVKGKDTVKVFVPDMCSSMTLDLDSETDIKGIDGARFIGTKRTFDNGSLYPEQGCYNVDGGVPTGVRDVSKCRFNAPAFLSFPHFYLADESYLTDIDGLQPNKTKHQLHFEIEPTTGIPLQVEAKVQVNIHIEKIPGIAMFSKAKSLYLPMLWFNQRALLTDDLASELKLLVTVPKLLLYSSYAFATVGTILILTGLILILNPNWKKDEVATKRLR